MGLAQGGGAERQEAEQGRRPSWPAPSGCRGKARQWREGGPQTVPRLGLLCVELEGAQGVVQGTKSIGGVRGVREKEEELKENCWAEGRKEEQLLSIVRMGRRAKLCCEVSGQDA
eukprot:scaffold77835_cov22-Tisochrysis_lutea.AAC.1